MGLESATTSLDSNLENKDAIKPVYTAYFVKDVAGLTAKFPPKHERVFAHHATIAFKPPDISSVQVGREAILQAVGKVSDEKAEALLLEGGHTNQKYLHITLSCAEGVSPIYSNELIDNAVNQGRVEKIDPPIIIETREGYFDGTSDITTSPQ